MVLRPTGAQAQFTHGLKKEKPYESQSGLTKPLNCEICSGHHENEGEGDESQTHRKLDGL